MSRKIVGPRASVVHGLAAPIAAAVIIIGYAWVCSNPYDLAVGVNMGVAAIATIGVTLTIGGAGQLALGQAGFMAIGAYATAYLLRGKIADFALAALISVVGSLLVGAAVGYIALRLRGQYLAVATLAVGSGIYSLLLIWSSLGGANGYAEIPPPELFGHTLIQPRAQYLLVAVVLVVVLVFVRWFERSRPGRELAAMRDDEVAATAVGIKITVRKVQVFAIASALGGLAGSLNAPIQSAIDPSLFSPTISLQLFVMAVLGGLGSIYGAVLGAALVTYILQSVQGSGSAALMILGGVVVVFMGILPGGLASAPARLRSLLHWVQRRRAGQLAARQQPPGLSHESEVAA